MGLSTHILDTTRGRPAAGVTVALERRDASGSAGEYSPAGSGTTNDDGRVASLLAPGAALEAGVYRLTFLLAPYFDRLGVEAFYPEASIVFEVRRPTEHHHVPLLLNPFGYATYRGS
jgi:5-hydroxyisourate hydrolase